MAPLEVAVIGTIVDAPFFLQLGNILVSERGMSQSRGTENANPVARSSG
jgi:hypothetical protein